MSNSVFEELAPEVFYSLKKKNRWEALNDVDSVLNTAAKGSPSCTVSAMERNPKGHLFSGTMHDNEVRVYGRIKAGSDEVEKISTKGGRGAPLLSLEDSLECRKGKKNKKEKSEEEEVKPREPEVTLIIDPQGDVEKLPSISFDEYEICRKGFKNSHKSNKFYNKMTYEEGSDPSESEGETLEESDKEHSDEVTELSKSFQLSDFVKSPSQKKEKTREKKVQDTEFIDEFPSEFSRLKNHEKPLDEHEILKDCSFFSKKFDLHSFFSKPEDFIPELEKRVEEIKPFIEIIWLDEDKSRCLIDFSKFLGSKNLIAAVGFSLVGENKRFLKVMFNTVFPFDIQKFTYEEKNFNSFFDLILNRLADAAKVLVADVKKFKPFEDTFQCKYDSSAEILNDYDLLERFSYPSDVHSESSFEVLNSDSCEFCGHENHTNLIKLSCIHSFCYSCIRLFVKDQVVNHSEDIVCPICESVQDLKKIAIVTPLPLVKTFLKEKFRRSSENETQQCFKCHGHFEKIPGASSVNCNSCCISFCQDCLQLPHFPISCDQMKTWFPKFEEQCKLKF